MLLWRLEKPVCCPGGGGGDSTKTANRKFNEIHIAPEVDGGEVGSCPGIEAVRPVRQVKQASDGAGGGNRWHRV
jgi:hypothetical protein